MRERERKYDELRTPCILQYKRAMLRVVCWPRVKTRLSRANGKKELDLWPTSSFSPVRHAYPPTRRRSGFLGHGCTRGRLCISTLSPRGPRGEALLASYHHGRTDVSRQFEEQIGCRWIWRTSIGTERFLWNKYSPRKLPTTLREHVALVESEDNCSALSGNHHFSDTVL